MNNVRGHTYNRKIMCFLIEKEEGIVSLNGTKISFANWYEIISWKINWNLSVISDYNILYLEYTVLHSILTI